MIKSILFFLIILLLSSCKITDSKESSAEEKNTKKEEIIDKSEPISDDKETEIVEAEIVHFDTLMLGPLDTIAFVLPNQYSLGRTWMVLKNPSNLELIDKTRIIKKTDDESEDYQELKFAPMKVGIYELVLENKRPFGIDTLDVKTHQQLIIVK